MTNLNKSNQTPGHGKNKRCRKDETVINRVRAAQTIMTHGSVMEGLPLLECELRHSHAMTVKYLVTDCANLASLRLRFLDGSNPNTLKLIQGRYKLNSNTIKFLKENKLFN